MSSEQPASKTDQDLHRDFVRGALINAVGLVSKILGPAFLIIATWLFGAETMGIYLLTTSMAEVAKSAVSSGFGDGAVVFASRYADTVANESEDRLYGVLGNAFFVPLGLTFLLTLLAFFGRKIIAYQLFEGQKGLFEAIAWICISLPLMVFSHMAVAATKARLKMTYEVLLNSILTPVCLTGFALIAWLLDAGLSGLLAGYVATQTVLVGTSIWALRREFEIRRLLRASLAPQFDMTFLTFAIPQGLTLTLSNYVNKLGLMALAAAGYSSFQIAFYATAERLVQMLREIKLLFSNSLLPVAARYYARKDHVRLEETLGQAARWTTTVVTAAILVIVVLRNDLLKIVDTRYQGDTRFMIVLLVSAFIYCAYGLAANVITVAGHSRWSLVNALIMAGAATALCNLLIPQYGLTGAAIAMTVAGALNIGFAMLELRWLEGIAIRFRYVWHANLGLVVGAVPIVALWDPAIFASLLVRAAFAGGVLALYVFILWVVGQPEARALVNRLLRRKAITAA